MNLIAEGYQSDDDVEDEDDEDEDDDSMEEGEREHHQPGSQTPNENFHDRKLTYTDETNETFEEQEES